MALLLPFKERTKDPQTIHSGIHDKIPSRFIDAMRKCDAKSTLQEGRADISLYTSNTVLKSIDSTRALRMSDLKLHIFAHLSTKSLITNHQSRAPRYGSGPNCPLEVTPPPKRQATGGPFPQATALPSPPPSEKRAGVRWRALQVALRARPRSVWGYSNCELASLTGKRFN